MRFCGIHALSGAHRERYHCQRLNFPSLRVRPTSDDHSALRSCKCVGDDTRSHTLPLGYKRALPCSYAEVERWEASIKVEWTPLGNYARMLGQFKEKKQRLNRRYVSLVRMLLRV